MADRPRTQFEHEAYNAVNYPGTRQLCCECGDPTERCENDSLYVDGTGPLCPECYRATAEYREDVYGD